MSGVIEKFLMCDFMKVDNCHANFGVDDRYRTIKQQRKHAKKAGWHYIKGKDCCTECWKKDGE